jgi:hypothetical protein
LVQGLGQRDRPRIFERMPKRFFDDIGHYSSPTVMLKRHFLFLAILLALLGSVRTYAQSEYPPGPPPGYRHEDRWHHDQDRQVVRAVYGAHGRYADVTEIVRHFARTREPFQVSNETFGVDPYRGKRKHLRVTIVRPDGDQLERSWEEGDMARL